MDRYDEANDARPMRPDEHIRSADRDIDVPRKADVLREDAVSDDLVQELEDTYGVKMSDEQAARILSVGQAVDFVVAHAPTPS